MILFDARKWWLRFCRLPQGKPNQEWEPFFIYLPTIVEGKLVCWQYVERRFWWAIDGCWIDEYRLKR